MRRRQFNQLIGALGCTTLAGKTYALEWSAIGQRDALNALQTSLAQGATQAVAQLGVTGGFMANPKVQIPLPKTLQSVAPLLKTIGQGKRLDELVLAMNTAAEQAVPMAKPLLLKAVKAMSIQDAKAILSGGETSVTDYFAKATREPLVAQFMPRVRQATQKVGVAQRYNALLGKAKTLGLGAQMGPDVETYVTDKALDGLFATIGEQERALRQNPAAAASKVVRTVFGALKL